MTATASLEDLQALRRSVTAATVAGEIDYDQRERLLAHVDTTIRVREAQKTKSRTPWHEERQAAFEAAMARWQAECEEAAIGYGTEIAEFKEQHPMPQFRDFMASDRPGNICPTCGSVLGE